MVLDEKNREDPVEIEMGGRHHRQGCSDSKELGILGETNASEPEAS